MLSKELISILFASNNYLEFLKNVLGEAIGQRGYKTQIAQYIGCQTSYFSQLLAGKVHLTPEQAERLCDFWELSETEADYFFHLTLHGRAGTQTLQKRLERKLGQIRQRWREEKKMTTPSMDEFAKAVLYYSHWLHSAVHILLTIPEKRTAKALAEHLCLDEEKIRSTLIDLEKAGLAEKTPEGWKPTFTQIHAQYENFFSEVHHKNWRAEALETRQGVLQSEVRYTSIHSLSKKDLIKIKTLIDTLIRESRQIIEASPEETVAGLLIDYFEIHPKPNRG